MLSFNIKQICKTRQIERPYTFLVKAGFSPHSATNILNSETRIFRLDHIEKLCQILHCEPNDLLVYKSSPNNPIQENHPLNKLMPKENQFNWQQTMKTIPLEKLKEIESIISNSNENKSEE